MIRDERKVKLTGIRYEQSRGRLPRWFSGGEPPLVAAELGGGGCFSLTSTETWLRAARSCDRKEVAVSNLGRTQDRESEEMTGLVVLGRKTDTRGGRRNRSVVLVGFSSITPVVAFSPTMAAD